MAWKVIVSIKAKNVHTEVVVDFKHGAFGPIVVGATTAGTVGRRRGYIVGGKVIETA